jgi:Trk-type K+ transport system membrane component
MRSFLSLTAARELIRDRECRLRLWVALALLGWAIVAVFAPAYFAASPALTAFKALPQSTWGILAALLGVVVLTVSTDMGRMVALGVAALWWLFCGIAYTIGSNHLAISGGVQFVLFALTLNAIYDETCPDGDA